jgi:hypothetical protein
MAEPVMAIEGLTEASQKVALVVGMLVPFHQAAIELWKLLGKKLARYYEALVYIIHGWVPLPGRRPRMGHLGPLENLFSGARLVPPALGPDQRRDWASGSEGRLMESFFLRGVGDSPETEISGTDIDNVVAIVRANSPLSVRHVLTVLDELLASGATDPVIAAVALDNVEPRDGVDPMLRAWSRVLRSDAGGARPVGVLLHLWRQQFLEEHLPGELRARTELGNAFKAAEYRYHNDLTRASLYLAVLEAAAVAWLVHGNQAWITAGAFVVALGGLLVLPRGTKGILDAITGIGSRLAG